MRIARWGDSLAVKLPAEVVDALGLKEGDEVELSRVPERSAEAESVADDDRRQQRLKLIEELHAMRGLFPADFKFDREEANAR